MNTETFQHDLSGNSFDRVAISLLKEHEPSEGYYLAFSGGKDSVVIHDLASRAGVCFEAHFSRTTVDPPEVLSFIKQNYPDVIWEKPKMSMFQLIKKKKMLPNRVRRFCCSELKEIGGVGRTVVTGVRAAESPHRRKRRPFEESKVIKGKYFVHPILYWTTQDVWDYIHMKGLPYCSLYDAGAERIGCIMCPLQTPRGMQWDADRYPKYYRAYMRAIEYIMKNRKKPLRWKTPEEMMQWWINER